MMHKEACIRTHLQREVMATSDSSQPSYRMPAEWEPHEAVWLQWPAPHMRNFPGYARKLLSSWLEMTAILAEYVVVRIAADSDAAAEDVVRDCARFGTRMERIEVHVIPLDDVWARDTGPIFVKGANGEVIATDWNFNGWGEPGAVIDRDKQVPTSIAALYGMKRKVGGIVLEGGAIEVNGTGSLMATRSSILNANRNPGRSQDEAEAAMAHLLGVSNFVWLKGASPKDCYRLGDATDFHIDLVARFAGRNVVLANRTDDENDPRKPFMDAHIAELENSFEETGAPIEVIQLPCPDIRSVSTVRFSGTTASVPPGSQTDASYSNYLVTNGLVLVPAYGRPEDVRARGIISEHFPGRDVIGISAIAMTEQGGAVHCVTQQQPSGDRAT